MSNQPPLPVQRFAEAGMLDADKLSEQERDMINALTESEVTALIGVANRMFGANKGLVKLGSLLTGDLRVCVPL
jgi:hypothetical protein